MHNQSWKKLGASLRFRAQRRTKRHLKVSALYYTLYPDSMHPFHGIWTLNPFRAPFVIKVLPIGRPPKQDGKYRCLNVANGVLGYIVSSAAFRAKKPWNSTTAS